MITRACKYCLSLISFWFEVSWAYRKLCIDTYKYQNLLLIDCVFNSCFSNSSDYRTHKTRRISIENKKKDINWFRWKQLIDKSDEKMISYDIWNWSHLHLCMNGCENHTHLCTGLSHKYTLKVGCNRIINWSYTCSIGLRRPPVWLSMNMILVFICYYYYNPARAVIQFF